MSENIKYSYDLEEIPANFDKYIAKINKDIQDYIRNTPEISKIAHHTRDAHANGYAALKAEVEILTNLPEELAQGIYKQAGKYKLSCGFRTDHLVCCPIN